MRIVKPVLGALAAGVLLTNGCLPHAPLRPPSENIGQVSPVQFCPDDTVTASYNVTQEQPCVAQPGQDCAMHMPTITVASTPMSFPAQTTTAFIGRVDFTPAADAVDVGFSAAAPLLFYPIVQMDGRPAFRGRTLVNNSVTVRRLTGEIMRTVDHGGMCAGATPVHADGVVPGPPALSPSLGIRQICNTSAAPIVLTLSGASGDMIERMLAPGGCFSTSEPGVPAGTSMLRTYSVRALVVDPNARCNATEGMVPPAPLQTTLTLSCGL